MKVSVNVSVSIVGGSSFGRNDRKEYERGSRGKKSRAKVRGWFATGQEQEREGGGRGEGGRWWIENREGGEKAGVEKGFLAVVVGHRASRGGKIGRDRRRWRIIDRHG